MTSGRAEPRFSLILVHQPGCQDIADFHAIADRVSAMAPDIEPFVVVNGTNNPVSRRKAARKPTFVFSPGRIERFHPERGRVYAGAPMSKLRELERLRDHGLPVPPFVELRPETERQVAELGPLVIVKPAFELSSHGRGAVLQRSNRVRHRAPVDYPADHPGRRGPMIVQRFVPTGPTPRHYRVLTLFGRPLFSRYDVSTIPFPPLDAPDEVLEQAVIVSSFPHRTASLVAEDDVLDLARRTYDAMPEIPLQGVDVLREEGTGALHVLEINPGGNTWIFSSQWSTNLKRSVGMDDLSVPFDSWRVAAEVLIERTRAEAV
jgi:hypothetical protein